jgi:hypothetical protein
MQPEYYIFEKYYEQTYGGNKWAIKQNKRQQCGLLWS